MSHRARALVAAYSASPSTDAEGRRAILERLLGEAGPDVWIEPPFFCDYGPNIHVGAHTFVNANCVLLDPTTIRIGAHVLLAPGVQLLSVTHPLRVPDRLRPAAEVAAGRLPYRTHAAPIVVGDAAWLGAGTLVMPGVTIGEGAVIGAGSVVTRDVPPGVLAHGNPCRVRREL